MSIDAQISKAIVVATIDTLFREERRVETKTIADGNADDEEV